MTTFGAIIDPPQMGFVSPTLYIPTFQGFVSKSTDSPVLIYSERLEYTLPQSTTLLNTLDIILEDLYLD